MVLVFFSDCLRGSGYAEPPLRFPGSAHYALLDGFSHTRRAWPVVHLFALNILYWTALDPLAHYEYNLYICSCAGAIGIGWVTCSFPISDLSSYLWPIGLVKRKPLWL